MRMPPFMRNSNAGPLTLANLAIRSSDGLGQAIESQPAPAAPRDTLARRAARPLSDGAVRRREQSWRVSRVCGNAARQEVSHDGHRSQ